LDIESKIWFRLLFVIHIVNIALLYLALIVRGSLRGGLSPLLFTSNLNVHLFILLATAPIVLHIWHWETHRWWKTAAGFSIIVFIPIGIFSQSRLFLIILAVFTTSNLLVDHHRIVGWKYPRKFAKFSLVTIPVFGVFIIHEPSVLGRAYQATYELIRNPSDTSRGLIYLAVIDLFSESHIFVTGLGYEGFRIYINSYYQGFGLRPPHSLFIKSLVEMGILGFVFIFMSQISAIKKSLSVVLKNDINPETKSSAASLIWAFSISTIFLVFEPLLQPPLFYILLALPYSILNSSSRV